MESSSAKIIQSGTITSFCMTKVTNQTTITTFCRAKTTNKKSRLQVFARISSVQLRINCIPCSQSDKSNFAQHVIMSEINWKKYQSLIYAGEDRENRHSHLIVHILLAFGEISNFSNEKILALSFVYISNFMASNAKLLIYCTSKI